MKIMRIKNNVSYYDIIYIERVECQTFEDHNLNADLKTRKDNNIKNLKKHLNRVVHG